MKIVLQIIMIGLAINVFGQKGITFKVEELTKPQELLKVQSCEDIYKKLIRIDYDLEERKITKDGIDFNFDIVAHNEAPDSLVNFGYNSFFNGMYKAYAEHRPFVLSPDMIWLLISQGFARHVHSNSESLRKYFVDFSGKSTLVINSNAKLPGVNKDWEALFPQITSRISEHVGSELINTLTSDFSTTTSIEKVASEITIMETMEPYFEYVVMYVVCGIPEITLQGTPEDWQKVIDKTRKLAGYDLKWWTSELEPVLKEFVRASKGDINKKFWRNMFKYHTPKKYGAQEEIDGWIVKFFPYDKEGKRNNLRNLVGTSSLPEEIVKVDLKFIHTDGIDSEESMFELWAGFIGLEQNADNYALTPKIGWMIRKKESDESGFIRKLEAINTPVRRIGENGIDIRITNVPESLKKFKEIFTLSLHFNDDVFIPEWLKDIRIGRLTIEGKISAKESEKVVSWFPNTDVKINGNNYNTGRNGWVQVWRNEFTDEVLSLKEIWVLEMSYTGREFKVPEALKNIKIAYLTINSEISAENVEMLKKMLPETTIYVNGKKITPSKPDKQVYNTSLGSESFPSPSRFLLALE